MPIIKRYPNRKLYNTDTKQYITLDGIADLIRAGGELQVIDNVSGNDLTAVTLSQIIFEQEKKQGGFLPKSVLTGLIKTGGNTLGSLRRSVAAPFELLRHVDDEIERRIEQLIGQGEMAREEGGRLLNKLRSAASGAESELTEDTVDALLDRHDIPRQRDLDQIMGQIESLNARLDELNETSNSSH